MADPSKEKQDRASSKQVGSLRGLLPFLAPYRFMIFIAAVALVFTAFISLILPIAVRRVVDGFGTEEAALLDQYFGAAVGIAALLAIGTGLRYYLVSRLGERVVSDIRLAVFNKTIGMSPAFFEKMLTGEVLSRITTDTTLILSVIGSSVSVALRNILIFFGGSVMMLFTSPKLAGLVALIIPVVIGPIIVLGRRLRALSRENQDQIAMSSGNASEALLAAQTVQAYTHENRSQKLFEGFTEAAFSAASKRIKARAFLTMIVIFLVFLGIVGVLWVGARDVRADVMSAGELVQFVIYAILAAGAVAALSEIWSELQRASGATERLIELLHSEDPVTDAEGAATAGKMWGKIEFRSVGFNYPARPEVAALDDVSFTVKPGETVALVGPSGAGKSTVLQLLLRFYDPQNGQVLIDEADIRDFTRASFRKSLALVPQEPVIFAASARDNIAFGRPDASEDEIIAAAKAAAADEFLAKLPDGYDSYLGERGVMLSGGQRQRIAIARAILRNSPILLLDEATSALDAQNELAVQTAVDTLSEGRTTLVVAHRLATVKKADRIIVFDQGQVVAEGTHDSLVAQGGLYSELARLQFTTATAAE